MPTKSAFCVFLPLVWVTIILVHRAVCTEVVSWSSVFCYGLLPLSTRKHEKTTRNPTTLGCKNSNHKGGRKVHGREIISYVLSGYGEGGSLETFSSNRL